MLTRPQILASLRSTAASLGSAPTRRDFLAKFDLKRSDIRRYFGTWPAALAAAGLTLPPGGKRLPDSQLLTQFGQITRKLGKLPTIADYRDHASRRADAIIRHFKRWSEVPRHFRNFAGHDPQWADVLAILDAAPPGHRHRMRVKPPRPPTHASPPRIRDHFRYGPPLPLIQLRHEPTDESGVIALFALLSSSLGFIIEAVRTRFPDCSAKRRIGKDRWECVLIEFEYESRNFLSHGHPPDGCDMIVCWKHNWPDCPKNLEVLELSSAIKALPLGELL